MVEIMYEAGWKQIDERTFAVQSQALVMSQAGLLVAVRQIPRHLRKDFLRWHWLKQYQDANGKRWLEFRADN